MKKLADAERAEIARILSLEPFVCHDCESSSFRVSLGPAPARRPVIEVFHLLTCPAYQRSSWSARACSDYIRAVLIIGGLHLADYGDGEVEHRRIRVARA
jgi:hypothetical protein